MLCSSSCSAARTPIDAMDQADMDGAAGGAGGGEDEEMQDVDLASVPSRWIGLDGIAAGEPGITMEDGTTNVDATRLTGCFVGKLVHNPNAQQLRMRSFRILGQARDRDSVQVVIVALRDDAPCAFHISTVYGLLSAVTAKWAFDHERSGRVEVAP